MTDRQTDDRLTETDSGGDTLSAYQYVIAAGGLDTEAAYPYTSGTTEQIGTCSPVSSKFAVTVTGDSIVAQKASEERERETDRERDRDRQTKTDRD